MESIIDTVPAYSLGSGDITKFGTVGSVFDDGDYTVTVLFEDDDYPLSFTYDHLIDLLGIVYSESV